MEEEEEGGEGATDRNDGDDDGDEDAKTSLKKKPKLKVGGAKDSKCIPGIIYLGHIPPRLHIGRIFLQPEGSVSKKKSGLRRCDFTEGWVEFRDKRVAKKRQRFASDLWCIKYLHRFQWTHLSERLAYEHTVLQQRLRTKCPRPREKTNFYLNNVDKGAHMDKDRRKRQRDGCNKNLWFFTFWSIFLYMTSQSTHIIYEVTQNIIQHQLLCKYKTDP
uniref:Activator of basal transcription 1 n=1 Tax=Sphaeramia orbicularis TaxID=375764 RepID=A0A673BDD2_9TELE